jgi:hypothetical protein
MRQEQDPTLREPMRRMHEIFPTREKHLAWQLVFFSEHGSEFDVTFHDRKPILGVKIGKDLWRTLAFGGSETAARRILENLRLSDGTVVDWRDIWTANWMPPGGPSEEALAAADMSQGDMRAGAGGETIREMIRATYHCATREEEDRFLRRWIAS